MDILIGPHIQSQYIWSGTEGINFLLFVFDRFVFNTGDSEAHLQLTSEIWLIWLSHQPSVVGPNAERLEMG